jgi:hypothetical protein
LARAGLATASRFKDIMSKVKSGESAGRRNYKMQLVTERLTGLPCETYQNAAMIYGTETEPLARTAYESKTGVIVEEQGFIAHFALDCGVSPDGIISDDGGLEIKAPFSSTIHVETILNGMPSEHKAQIYGALWITGRKWWDFVSFDPRLPENLQLYIQRIERDEAYIENLETEVLKFLEEVKELELKLRALK